MSPFECGRFWRATQVRRKKNAQGTHLVATDEGAMVTMWASRVEGGFPLTRDALPGTPQGLGGLPGVVSVA